MPQLKSDTAMYHGEIVIIIKQLAHIDARIWNIIFRLFYCGYSSASMAS